MTQIDDPFRLDGRTAIVTGASSGLGNRFARVLAAAGAEVVATARRAERLEALAAEVDGIHAFACDVTDPQSRELLVAHAVERFGRIDVLVNNAGLGGAEPAETETVAHFETGRRRQPDRGLRARAACRQADDRPGSGARSSTSPRCTGWSRRRR